MYTNLRTEGAMIYKNFSEKYLCSAFARAAVLRVPRTGVFRLIRSLPAREKRTAAFIFSAVRCYTMFSLILCYRALADHLNQPVIQLPTLAAVLMMPMPVSLVIAFSVTSLATS